MITKWVSLDGTQNLNRKEINSIPISKEENEQLSQEVSKSDGLLDDQQFYDHCEHQSEMFAETAWVRHTESLGWEEAWLESLIESGLRIQ